MSIPQILKMLGILFFGCAMSAGATTPTTTTSKKHSSGTVHASGKAKAKSGASHTASTKSKSAHVAVTSHRSGHGAKAKLAVQIFTRSVKKAIGGFVALMGGLDALIFSGGIGEHDAQSRAEIAGGLAGIGISIDSALNVASESGLRRISASESGTVIFVVPSQEDLMIASHVDRMSRVGL